MSNVNDVTTKDYQKSIDGIWGLTDEQSKNVRNRYLENQNLKEYFQNISDFRTTNGF
jgi:hypothetical protein